MTNTLRCICIECPLLLQLYWYCFTVFDYLQLYTLYLYSCIFSNMWKMTPFIFYQQMRWIRLDRLNLDYTLWKGKKNIYTKCFKVPVHLSTALFYILSWYDSDNVVWQHYMDISKQIKSEIAKRQDRLSEHTYQLFRYFSISR